jgi:hypothetical protein
MGERPDTDSLVAAHEVRLNGLNGSLVRAADAQAKIAERVGGIEVDLAAFKAETKGEHKATRKELRLIGLAVAVATIGSKYLPTPTHDVAHAALRMIGLG